MAAPLATLESGSCKAEIFDTALPGKFSVRYLREDGSVAAEEPLSGVSSYKQREKEILEQLDRVCRGEPIDTSALSDSGEY